MDDELVPYEGGDGSHPLKPIPDDVGDECRALALELRRLFAALRMSVRRYAALKHRSAGSVSRYLSGSWVAPDDFVVTLMNDAARELNRPLSAEAHARVIALQRNALRVTNETGWRIQDLEDRLVGATQEAQLARTSADAMAMALRAAQQAVVEADAERQRLEAVVITERADGDAAMEVLHAEQHRVRTERDQLRERVEQLEQALEAAQRRVEAAERRCDELERELVAAEEVVEAEEDEGTAEVVVTADAGSGGSAVEAELREERDRLRAELDRLLEERLLAEEVADMVPLHEVLTGLPPGPASGPAPADEPYAVVYARADGPSASWITKLLESRGHEVTAYRWAPVGKEPPEEALSRLLGTGAKVVLVLSRNLAAYGPEELSWEAAVSGIVRGRPDRFLTVCLDDSRLSLAAAGSGRVGLAGADEAEAKVRMLRALESWTTAGPAPAEPAAPAPVVPARVPAVPPGRASVFGQVPLRNPRFTGRESLLDELRGSFRDGTPVRVLAGMPGVGKTELAAEYAHRFGDDYDMVWWVDARRPVMLRQEFGELAQAWKLPPGADHRDQIRAVREALRRGIPYSRWLIVFDGWDDDIDPAVLPEGLGHVLITSRNRSWADHADLREVPVFDRDESIGVLRRAFPHFSANETERLADGLFDVPAALALAVDRLAESRTGAADFLRALEEGGLWSERALGDRWPDFVLVGRLYEASPHAAQLLRLCTDFAPGRIPLGRLRDLPEAELPAELGWITDSAAWSAALHHLVDSSLITRDEEDAHHGMVSMHPFVHSLVTHHLADDGHALRRTANRLLVAAVPGRPQKPKRWPRYAELLTHLEPSGALESLEPRTMALVLDCLRYCVHGGDYRTGAALAERVREQWRTRLAPDDRKLRELAVLQGDLLRASGDFDAAYALDRTALDPQSADVAERTTALGRIAADHRLRGAYEEALRTQRSVFETATQLYGPDDRRTLAAQHHLAAALRLTGQYADAHREESDALKRYERTQRTDHPDALESAGGFARDLRLMGRYADARARQEQTVRVQRATLGPNHPHTLRAEAELLMCRLRAGEPVQNIGSRMAQLHDRLERAHGRAHHRTAALVCARGNLLRAQGDLQQAERLLTDADDVFRELLGTEHPVVLGMRSNLALGALAVGMREHALRTCDEALEGLTGALGADHPWTLGCVLNNTAVLSGNGRIHEAVEFGRDAARRSVRVLGAEHPLTLSCHLALSSDLRAMGEHAEAHAMEEHELSKFTTTLGAHHPLTVSARRRVRPTWDFEPQFD
ncbi:FxSxx-COOH system tetratricopeptide repeat protein [Streptomyces sp. NPDC000410]|uniref:FxSxx-COOH system tetratricopeptide repeat protein n=1 Tax=Streptomyces sp. NPDC000410 TaxID=3154254 RepID=UPI0033312291